MSEQIGKYRILERVGRGGMGTVYKAHDPILKRLVALKVISADVEITDELKARFYREARACAKLNHPNIIIVYDLGEDGDQLFIVMEFLEGEELKRIIAHGRPRPLEEKLSLMIQVCDGLHYAHQHGVIHRDIKPGNIFVQGNGQVKILDFGIARITAADSGLTRTGLIMGTLRYMSPEQARGRVDHRSDLFSVGSVFYELLTYRPAFDRENPVEILEQLRSEDPPSLRELDPTLPPELVAIIERALRKDPAERFADLAEMRAALEAVRRRLTDEAEQALVEVQTQLDEAARLDEPPDEATTAPAAASPDIRLPTAPEAPGLAASERAPTARARRFGLTHAAVAAVLVLALAGAGAWWLRGRPGSSSPAAAPALVASPTTPVPPPQAAVSAPQAAPTPAPGVAEAEQAREVMVAARDAAVKIDAEQLAPGLWSAAGEKARDADGARDRQDFARAETSYREAGEAFERAAAGAREVVDMRRAQGQAAEARRGAQAGEAARLAAALWARATSQERQAEDALKRQELGQAQALFEGAARAYREAEGEAARKAAAERERIAAVQRELATTEPVAAAAAAARREAEEAGAGRRAAPTLTRGQDKEKEGQAALLRQDYALARERLREAQEAYRRARDEALEGEKREAQQAAQREREVTEARSQAAQARGVAEQAGARELAPRAWADAAAKETDGQAALGRKDYGVARERLREAREAYRQAAQAAQREAGVLAQRQQEAADLRDQAAQARALAERAAQEAQQAAEAEKRQALAASRTDPPPAPAGPSSAAPSPTPPADPRQPAGRSLGDGVLGAVKRAFGRNLGGVSGPVAWEVVGVRTETVAERQEIRWHYTLVLRETQGASIQFERVLHAISRGGTSSTIAEERFPRRLPANSELRLLRSDAVTYASAPGAEAASVREGLTVWRRFYGKDDKGKEVVIDVQFHL